MSWQQIKALKERRADHVTNAGKILKRATDETRDMTPEEEKEFEELHKLGDQLLAQIEKMQKQDSAEDSLDSTDSGDTSSEEQASRMARGLMSANEVRDSKPKNETEELQRRAFSKKLRGFPLSEKEQRALTIGGTGTGAEMVPQSFWQGYYEKLRTTGSIRAANPFVETTQDGRSTPYPIYDDTSNEGEIITAGGTATGSADPATDQLVLQGFVFSSKRFSLAKNYMQDVAHDAEAAAQKMGADRVAAHLDRKLTVGAGGGTEPQGAVTGASVGKTGSTTSGWTYNEVLDLIHSLAAPYRDGAVLMFNDATLLATKKLVDADGNNIWFSGVAGNAGAMMSPTIAGVPYIVNPYMANFGASAKAALYANFARGYIVRDVVGAELLVDPFTNGGKYLIDYILFSRHDGGVIDSSALKVFQNAAS